MSASWRGIGESLGQSNRLPRQIDSQYWYRYRYQYRYTGIIQVYRIIPDVNAEIASKEPNKARLLWAKLDEWWAFDTLTRSSVVVMGRLRELETEFAHRTEVVPESALV
eukprot:COSAG05_NODE_22_length_32312_cov_23.410890_12_plen_109_part_00